MTKTILTIVLPLATPFVLYFGYIVMQALRGGPVLADGAEEAEARRHPWLTLSLIGVALSILSMVALGLGLFGDPSQASFAPARLIDGQIVVPSGAPASPGG